MNLALPHQLHHYALVLNQRVKRNVQDYGFRRTLVKAVGSLTSGIFYTRAYILYRTELDRYPFGPSECGNFVIRYIEPGETHLLEQIKRMEEWLDQALDEILQWGGKCLVALDRDRIAGFNLVSFRRIHLRAVDFTRNLRPREAYSEQITVAKTYRGRQVATMLREELFRTLGAQGINIVYGGADINNRASLALSRKVGFTPVASIRLIRVFGQKSQIIRRSHS